MNIAKLLENSEFVPFYDNFIDLIIPQEEDEEVYNLRLNFVDAVDLHFKENPQQIKTVIAPRRIGKSSYIKMHALWNCLYNDNITNVVVSFRDSMPECYFQSVVKVLEQFEKDTGVRVYNSISRKEIEFENGSRLVFCAYCPKDEFGEYTTPLEEIRGRIVNTFYLDEFAAITDKRIFWKYLVPHNPKNIWIMSSAGYKKDADKEIDLLYLITLFSNGVRVNVEFEDGNPWGHVYLPYLYENNWKMEYGNVFVD